MVELYPAIEPYDEGMLAVGDGNLVHWSLAWLAADVRPNKINKVALIGGPSPDGKLYADSFPTQEGAMAFPGWDPFEGPDSAELDDATKQAIASAAVPVPEGSLRGWSGWLTSAVMTSR